MSSSALPKSDSEPAASVPARPPGRPKDADKHAAILDAAKQLFVQHGYVGVSMDQIAASAGVSKLTLYSHFGDKENLFAAAVRAFCEHALPDITFRARPDLPMEQHLLQVGRAFFAMIMSPEAIAAHRILCSPQLGDSCLPASFWEAGPQRTQKALATLLADYAAQGQLDIDDPDLAASQLATLLKGDPHAMALFGTSCSGRNPEPEEHLQATMHLFLRAYRPRP